MKVDSAVNTKTMSPCPTSIFQHKRTLRCVFVFVCPRVAELLTQAVAILGVEAGVVDEVNAAADHVPCCKRGSVGLPGAR